MKTWNEVKKEFEDKTSLRDIYLEDGNTLIWEKFIQSIKSSNYEIKFRHGDFELNLPDSFSKIRNLQNTNPTTLSLWLSEHIEIHCHFFSEEEIELDLSPDEIISESEYQLLINFLKFLSNTLKSRIILTHENSPDQLILVVE